MMHPSSELRWVNESIGFGVYANEFIPKGTMVYVLDPLEVILSADNPILKNSNLKAHIDKYCYIDQSGQRIISWDHAKYVNHSCNPNSMSTGYGFEIALRDIEKDEEITDEYGLLNIETPMPCDCGSNQCRKLINPNDIKIHTKAWDINIKDALIQFHCVEQPLAEFLTEDVKEKLFFYLDFKKKYQSIQTLRTQLQTNFMSMS